MSDQDIAVHDLASLPVAVMRRQVRVGELPRVVPECCGLVWSALRAQGVKGGRHVAIYWDTGIRLEVGVEALEPFDEGDDLVRSATPAGLTVRSTHFGPYRELGKTHEAIQRWCAARGHALAGPSWEIYAHWAPEWNEQPALIRTDVFYQVATG